MDIQIRRFAYRVRRALAWRIDPGPAQFRWLEAKRPDRFDLHGINLPLGPWATDPIRGVIYAGGYESKERSIVEATLRPEDVVVELGAGAGYLTTVAAHRARSVTSFEADPALVDVARQTLALNGRAARVEHAAVMPGPTEGTMPFYVRDEFWVSSAQPDAQAHEIRVPVREFGAAIGDATYLLVDVEGAEVDLLRQPLPAVRAICVECHPAITPPESINAMLTGLFEQGFSIGVISQPPVLYLERMPSDSDGIGGL